MRVDPLVYRGLNLLKGSLSDVPISPDISCLLQYTVQGDAVLIC